MNDEKNAYTQDLASDKVKVSSKKSDYNRKMMSFAECKYRINTLQSLARYVGRKFQLIENSSQFYAARVCTESGSVYLSCNAATNTMLSQNSPTCPFK